MTKYPDAKIRDDFDCEVCGKLVTKVKSPRAKYCKECSKEVNDINVLLNVRKYMAKKRNLNRELFRDANKEHGISIDPDDTVGETRIDATHSSWDAIIGTKFKVLGTLNESDLKVGEDGHVKAWRRLKRQIDKIKGKTGNYR